MVTAELAGNKQGIAALAGKDARAPLARFMVKATPDAESVFIVFFT